MDHRSDPAAFDAGRESAGPQPMADLPPAAPLDMPVRPLSDWNDTVEPVATAPAKIFGMYPRKGTIAVGCDADVVVWDPNRAKTLGVDTLHMRVDYSPFEGRQIVGAPSHVLSRGDLVVHDDRWVGKAREGRGRFFKRGTFAL